MTTPLRKTATAVRASYHDLRAGGRGRVLAFVAAGWLVVLGTRFVFPALLPGIKAEFAISNTTAGLAISAIWFAYALMQFPSGTITDRVGERYVLVASVAVAVVSVTVVATTPTFGVFLAGCVLFGLGTGLYGPPRVIVLSNIYPDRDSTAISLTFAAGSVGAAALPFVAGVLAGRGDWRLGFAVVVPLLLVVAPGLWVVVPTRSSDAARAAERSARHVAGRLASALADRSILFAWAAMALSLFVFQGFTAFFPTYLVTVKGLSPGTAATVFGAFFVTGSVFQPVAGSLADRYGQGPTLAALAGFGALPLLALPFVGDPLPLAALTLLLGLRQGLGPVNNAYIAGALPEDVQGAGYGFVRTFHMIVGSTGSVVVGALADADLFDGAFVVLAAVSVVMVALYLQLAEPDAR